MDEITRPRKVQFSQSTDGGDSNQGSYSLDPRFDDYHLDSDSQGLQIQLIKNSLNRSHSRPSSVSSADTSNSHETKFLPHESTSATTETPASSNPSTPTQEYAVPIPFGEIDGLPQPPSSKKGSFDYYTKKARKLVGKKSESSHNKKDKKFITNKHDPESGDISHSHDDPFSLDYKPSKSRGVLSTLLTLQEQREHHKAKKKAKKQAKKDRRARSVSTSSSSSAGTVLSNSGAADQLPEKPPPTSKPQLPRSHSETNLADVANGGLSSAQEEDKTYRQYKPSAFRIPDQLRLRPEKYRPKTARSSAGVFGALVSSGQNLSGFVSPHSTAITPNLKHKGYRLQRYSLDPTLDIKEFTKDNQEAEKAESLDMKHSRSSSTDLESLAPSSPPLHTAQKKSTPKSMLKDQFNNMASGFKNPKSPATTPDEKMSQSSSIDYFSLPLKEREKEKEKSEERELKERKKNLAKRKKEELYITMHVATVLHRQEFLLKLSRALMMFGAPSHRLEAQIQATARVLDIPLQVVYLPGLMLFSFGDVESHTSETKFLKQSATLDLRKLLVTHQLYWRVTHDEMSVSDASKELDVLMTQKDNFNALSNIVIAGFCSAFITPFAFHGSLIDACLAAPLGMLLVAVQQIAVKNDLFTNIFEISMAAVNSFLAASLAETNKACYSAVASGSVVLILPGYIILCGALEMSARNIIAGSVRMFYAIIFSSFLGVGMSIGYQFFRLVTNQWDNDDNSAGSDYRCASVHTPDAPFYQKSIDPYWYILCVPIYAIFISLRNKASIKSRELPLMVIIAICGFTVNYFVRQRISRIDLSSAVGSFTVGLIGNLWGKFTTSRPAFTMTASGIMLLLPTGLSDGGILSVATTSTSNNSLGLGTSSSLIQAAIGLTVGLFAAAVVAHPFGGTRRRRAAIFSF
ncbi:hypothetical protein J056_004300 [Wallemia ichthyophaga EXF-994]|uniref:Threonine/serine exporter-like N-terminal domain-containing protein n=1 Tax=Wallemia ichthyophaga (strain EXF-994 / CBS 113033) TaxID=1299270 RepID=R9AH11_WALI9|nr:uncharacterized protein J056_004300 [Wallemia ichthyophaga EXF-994]EOR01514.1 hypothetical protein J056_004300 [Wallemia ichthyophaga EXF-994]TIB34644.1 hypothetical protein E3P84_01704 [Wallemia ichthyophaga]TIB41758.1 hypothetical protein E3P83_01653 [Wallemia ichthyophaga]